MSKLKKLASVHERYNLSLEHQFQETAPGVFIPRMKATLIIPGENNTFLKRVSTNFITGASLQEAEKLAIDTAVDLLLGNKLTKRLTDAYKVFDLQLVPFTGTKAEPVGVKAILNVCTEDGKPVRQANSLATGTDSDAVEVEVLKAVINNVLGV
jgi:hypothetical protein